MNTEIHREDTPTRVAICCGLCTGWQAVCWGIVLILLGALGVLGAFVPLPVSLGRFILPALLVLWGSFLVFNARRRGH